MHDESQDQPKVETVNGEVKAAQGEQPQAPVQPGEGAVNTPKVDGIKGSEGTVPPDTMTTATDVKNS